MASETTYRIAFLVLVLALLAMRFYFMLKVRRSGGRLMPVKAAVAREGGSGIFILRIVLFIGLLTLLGLYIAGVAWIDTFRFPLQPWLRWAGFALGAVSVFFWTWAQIHLDTQWSAQLQLSKEHHIVTTGPYAHIRHPLYAAMFGWCIGLSLLTANWIFVAACALSMAGILWRVPKEERMLVEAFGDEYKAYMQRTGKFFPKF